jgi:UDP-N-acetylmuramoyl-tripeptide--D-alanyl-D-alanine ligase
LPILALTGSNGKTTTKELINVVLSRKFKTKATKGNLNKPHWSSFDFIEF